MPSENAGIGGDKRSLRWWKADLTQERRRQVVRQVVQSICKAQIFRKEAALRHARLYSNMPILGFGVASYSRPLAMQGNRLAYNVVKSCSDAFTAKLTKDRPKCTFVTAGGDEKLQQQAKGLDQYAEGQLYESKFYDVLPSVVLDACIGGTGVLKIFADFIGGEEGSADDKPQATVRMERIFHWELIIDDQEAMYGAPRNLYQRKYYDRLVAMEMAKQWDADESNAAGGKGDQVVEDLLEKTARDQDDLDGVGYDATADQVMVTECWHLPSGPRAKDGRHCVVVENATLLDEPYTQDYFPFAFFNRQKSPVGFWGIGLAEELLGLQLEINILLQKIQRTHHLLGSGHWLVGNGSKINTGKLDNDIGSIIRFTGEPPTLEKGISVTPEIFEHLEVLYHKAYEITGISELDAKGQLPKEMEGSGKAMSVYANINTERFSVAVRNLHEFVVETVRQTIDRARDIAKVVPDFEVRAHSDGVLKVTRFLDVDMREQDRILKMYPTNLLSGDPAEKIAQLKDLSGFYPPDDLRRAMDFPDLKAMDDYADASFALIQSYIQDWKDLSKEPDYSGPEPFMDLVDGTKRVQLAYLVAKRNKLPEERLQLFRDWIADAQKILNPPPPPPAAPAPGANLLGGPPTLGAPPPPGATLPAPAGMAMGLPGGPPPAAGPMPPPGPAPAPPPGPMPMPGP